MRSIHLSAFSFLLLQVKKILILLPCDFIFCESVIFLYFEGTVFFIKDWFFLRGSKFLVCKRLIFLAGYYSGTPTYDHPVSTTTWLLRPLSQSFSYLQNHFNTTTLLMRPVSHGPKVVVLTGFHCPSSDFREFAFN